MVAGSHCIRLYFHQFTLLVRSVNAGVIQAGRMKTRMQFGLGAVFIIATIAAVLANWHGRKLDREKKIDRALEMFGALSAFDHHDVLDDQNPNPVDIIVLINHLRLLGDKDAIVAMRRFCKRFPIDHVGPGDSRTTILDSIVPTFWENETGKTALPHWYYSGSRSRGVKFSGTGDGRYTLTEAPWLLGNSLTVVDGIPFDNMYGARLLGPYHASREYLVEWAAADAKLRPTKLTPPDNPMTTLEKATQLLLDDYTLKNSPSESQRKWVEFEIKGHLCDQIYEMTKTVFVGFERPPYAGWLNSSGGFDVAKTEELAKLTEKLYWDDRSNTYRIK